MEDSVVTELEVVNKIEEYYEPFTNPQGMSLWNNFIPDHYESSDCSDTNDEEEDDFYKDEVFDADEILL